MQSLTAVVFIVVLHECMPSIYKARTGFLQPKQPRVHIRRLNQKGESLSCYRTDSMPVSCPEVFLSLGAHVTKLRGTQSTGFLLPKLADLHERFVYFAL